jgi:hypothetical protein
VDGDRGKKIKILQPMTTSTKDIRVNTNATIAILKRSGVKTFVVFIDAALDGCAFPRQSISSILTWVDHMRSNRETFLPESLRGSVSAAVYSRCKSMHFA